MMAQYHTWQIDQIDQILKILTMASWHRLVHRSSTNLWSSGPVAA